MRVPSLVGYGAEMLQMRSARLRNHQGTSVSLSFIGSNRYGARAPKRMVSPRERKVDTLSDGGASRLNWQHQVGG